MATPGKGRGLAQGTRAPAGLSASVQFSRIQYVTSAMWPGWTDNGDGQCSCSWSYKDGIRQVKFSDGACPVRHRESIR